MGTPLFPGDAFQWAHFCNDMQINGIHKSLQMSPKIRKSQATINLETSAQIYNMMVRAPVLYMVALSELKLNENSEHDGVVMYQNMLHV